MFMVVLSHVLYNNHLCSFNWFMWHIPGFIIISGWFGIRFRWRKMLKLIATVYACYWLAALFNLAEGVTFSSLLIPHGGWFLPFYCLLMLFSPICDAAMECRKQHKLIFICIMTLIIVGWIPLLSANPHLARIRVPGMQGHGLLLMIGIYMLARFARYYDVREKLSLLAWCMCFSIGILACGVIGNNFPGSVCYASPIAIATAFCGFELVRSIPPPRKNEWAIRHLRGLLLFVAPSMWSVYLLHECCIKNFNI